MAVIVKMTEIILKISEQIIDAMTTAEIDVVMIVMMIDVMIDAMVTTEIA
jgi:hypothetical protein